jgi:hypothetical protein
LHQRSISWLRPSAQVNQQAGLMGGAALQTTWEVMMMQNRKKRPLASTAVMP